MLASVLIVGVIEGKLQLRSSTDVASSSKVLLGLSSYERRIAFTIWGMLLERLAGFWYAKSAVSTAMMEASASYSVRQCLLVVEIFITAILLTILKTETIMHAIATASNYLYPRPNDVIDTVNFIPIRRVVYVVVVAVNTVTVLLPQVDSIGIANFPLWLLHFLVRTHYYELYLCLFWIAMIAVFSVIAYYAAAVWGFPRTCNRKIFHFLVVLMFAPALYCCSRLLLVTAGMSGHATTREALYSTWGYRIVAFLELALGVAVNVFILFEYIRLCLLDSPALVPRTANSSKASSTEHSLASDTISNVAALGHRMEHYMQLFLPEGTRTTETCVDCSAPVPRGVKTLEMSHISLLLGCAAPVWLFALMVGQSSPIVQGNVEHNDVKIGRILLLCVVPYAGLLTLGIGDACAAIVGKLYGTHRWYGREGQNSCNTRTIEGSVACFVSMLCAVTVLVYSQYISMQHMLVQQNSGDGAVPSFVVFMCTPSGVILSIGIVVTLFLTTAAEAVTTENDNILLPMYMIILLLAWCEVFL